MSMRVLPIRRLLRLLQLWYLPLQRLLPCLVSMVLLLLARLLGTTCSWQPCTRVRLTMAAPTHTKSYSTR